MDADEFFPIAGRLLSGVWQLDDGRVLMVLGRRLFEGTAIRLLDGAGDAIEERGALPPRSVMGVDQKMSSGAWSSSSTAST